MFDKLLSFLNTLTPNIDNTSGGEDVDVAVEDIDGDVEVNVYSGGETGEKAGAKSHCIRRISLLKNGKSIFVSSKR